MQSKDFLLRCRVALSAETCQFESLRPERILLANTYFGLYQPSHR